MTRWPRVLLLGLAIAVLSAAAAVGGPRYEVRVAGLACPFCAYGIEKNLMSLPAVEAVETHIRDGTVIVTVADEAKLDEAAVERAIEEAGFTLQGFRRVDPPAP